MMSYQRNGKPGPQVQKSSAQPTKVAGGPAPAENDGEKKVRINGMQQIVDMLQVADRDFRESLLKRVTARNPNLGAQLRTRLGQRG